MLDPRIFKANDIRGVVVGDAPEWDLDGARALGAAFVALTGAGEFVLGRDMRVLGRELSLAFADGARRAGASVVDIGLASTDQRIVVQAEHGQEEPLAEAAQPFAKAVIGNRI